MVLLQRIVPYIEPNLSDKQAGFRKECGCHDNLLILTMAINHLLENVQSDNETAGIITYIDLAAFDSINHSYMLQSLKQYGVPLKYIRLVRAIYRNAAVQVRIQEVGGSRKYSRVVAIRRDAIKGDIPSPVAFLVALDRLLKEHGDIETGIPITPVLTLSDVKMGQHKLDNAYSFVYLGSEKAGDGDQLVTLKHRCNIAWGRYSQRRAVLTSRKLPISLRLRLCAALIASTMVYGFSGWFFTNDVRKRLNNVSSKMLSSITKRFIHAKAG